jgi:hypothetical protein
VHRSRHALNGDTIREMHLAFRRGGRKAIDKVMKTQPAVFLKLLVLLVPREMQVEHRGGVKAMSDDQLEAAIEAITAMLACLLINSQRHPPAGSNRNDRRAQYEIRIDDTPRSYRDRKRLRDGGRAVHQEQAPEQHGRAQRPIAVTSPRWLPGPGEPPVLRDGEPLYPMKVGAITSEPVTSGCERR